MYQAKDLQMFKACKQLINSPTVTKKVEVRKPMCVCVELEDTTAFSGELAVSNGDM